MKKRTFIHILLFLALGLSMCVLNAQMIRSIVLCKNVKGASYQPVGISEVFGATTPILHAVVMVEGVAENIRITGTWISVDAINVPNYRIDESGLWLEPGEERTHFQITRPNNNWPVGNYFFEVSVKGRRLASHPFKIVKSGRSENGEREKNKLSGNWISNTNQGVIKLTFLSENRLLFNGEQSYYSLHPGIIQIQEDYGVVDYPYSIINGILAITFPEGYQLRFEKEKPASSKGRVGQEHLLKGTLCHYSGSSGGGSSYSSTTWMYFDGTGNFSYGTQSSFSSNSGSLISGENQPTDTGTYYISGENVYLTYSGGGKDVMAIHIRQRDGRITELKHNNDLYAAGLCD